MNMYPVKFIDCFLMSFLDLMKRCKIDLNIFWKTKTEVLDNIEISCSNI